MLQRNDQQFPYTHAQLYWLETEDTTFGAAVETLLKAIKFRQGLTNAKAMKQRQDLGKMVLDYLWVRSSLLIGCPVDVLQELYASQYGPIAIDMANTILDNLAVIVGEKNEPSAANVTLCMHKLRQTCHSFVTDFVLDLNPMLLVAHKILTGKARFVIKPIPESVEHYHPNSEVDMGEE